MDNAEIQAILQTMGRRVPPASPLILIGGSALSLLGSPRPTIDIDFVGDDIHPEPLHQIILRIADELYPQTLLGVEKTIGQPMTDRLTKVKTVGRVGTVFVRPISRPTSDKQTRNFLRRNGLDCLRSNTALGNYD